MKSHKTIATVMIVAGSVLVGWASRDIAFPAILCMLGLLGLQRRLTWELRPERRVIASLLLLLLAMLFAVHYRYIGSRVPTEDAALVAWQTIARYFLASMILVLFLGSPNRLPLSLGLFHLAAVLAAAQALLLDDRYMAFRLAEVFAVVMLVLYAATARGAADKLVPRRAGRVSYGFASALVLVFAANCGWIVGSVLYRNVEILDYLPRWPWRANSGLDGSLQTMARVGFSDSGRLSSVLQIKGEQDTTPVLSIACERSPGYLRARAFEKYRHSTWTDLSHRDDVPSTRNSPFGMRFVGRSNVFRLGSADVSEFEIMTVRHEAAITNLIFTPLGTCYLEAPFDFVMRDDDDIVYPPNVRNSLVYRVAFGGAARRRPGIMQRYRLLEIPPQLDPRVKQLAERVFAGCNTTAEKIDAVVRHFHSNYSYLLGLEVPDGWDNLDYFLLEASTGYCEYFASGAAILLRLAGIPSRYVTGFLVTAKDDEGDLWVARNMDAHAWAEAWDSDRGQWTIVEATTQEALAAGATDEDMGRGAGSTYLFLRQLLESLHSYGLLGPLTWLFSSYRLIGVAVILSMFSVGLVWWVLRRRRRRAAGRMRGAMSGADFAVLHKMLMRMDRKVRAVGPRRELSETLHAFSRRLRGREDRRGLWTRVADWYRDYADLRYGRTIAAERIQHLQQRARRLRHFL